MKPSFKLGKALRTTIGRTATAIALTLMIGSIYVAPARAAGHDEHGGSGHAAPSHGRGRPAPRGHRGGGHGGYVDNYYAPAPNYYTAPEPAYYYPSQPGYESPPPAGINLFFGL